MVAFAFQSAPPAPFVPAAVQGAPVVALALCHVGPPEEGERAIAPLRALRTAAGRRDGADALHGRAEHDGRGACRSAATSTCAIDHLTGLGDDVIDACVRHAAAADLAALVVVVIPLGGAVARVGEHDTAFSHRQTPSTSTSSAIWTDPRESDAHLAWGRGFGAALQPFSRGAYINEMGSEGDERIRARLQPPELRAAGGAEEHLRSDELLADEPEHQADRLRRGDDMALKVRRVITGHDAAGKAIVKIDEIATHAFTGRPGATGINVWTTEGFPANNDGAEDAGLRKVGTTLPNGTIFRVLEFAPGLAARNHRTDSIDYIVVMSGEIDMELDDSIVHLKAGDVMVQRGTIHNWVNNGTAPCLLAVILIAAKSVEAGGKVLTAAG